MAGPKLAMLRSWSSKKSAGFHEQNESTKADSIKWINSPFSKPARGKLLCIQSNSSQNYKARYDRLTFCDSMHALHITLDNKFSEAGLPPSIKTNLSAEEGWAATSTSVVNAIPSADMWAMFDDVWQCCTILKEPSLKSRTSVPTGWNTCW